VSSAASLAHRRVGRERLRATKRGPSRLWITLVALLSILLFAGTVAIAALIVGLISFGQFAGALPPADQVVTHQSFQTTRVYGSDRSTLLYEITDPEGGRRTLVPLAQVPRSLVEATVATEDAGFFSNPGFELRSMLRAAIDNLSQKQIVSGASTITQQVVRNVLLTPEERTDLSARRKIREVILAYQITQTYSKEDILQIYLNEIPYGNRTFGVEAAAEGYFGKSVGNLDLAESAMLAGIPQAPGFYDPYRRFDDVKDRQLYVLQRMVDQGYISEDEAIDAGAEDLHFVDRLHAVLAPHFVAYVSDDLAQILGADRLYNGGYDAVTTLDLDLQRTIQSAIGANEASFRDANANNVAVVALDPRSGRVLALVGSASYDDSSIAGEVNMALAQQQSGGILSPVTYALALKSGQTLNTVVDLTAPASSTAVDVVTGGRQAKNTTTIREALARGLEQPANQMMRLIGNESFVNTMVQTGISDFGKRVNFGGDQTIAGAQVSPLEVAQVYATLANGGTAHSPSWIQQVVDQAGQTVWQAPSTGFPALDPNAAFLVWPVLSDPAHRPMSRDLVPDDAAVAAHVALSSDHRDSWAAGYDSNLVVVVWIGNANGQVLKDNDVAAAILGDIFHEILITRSAVRVDQPPDVVEVDLCSNPGCTVRHGEYVVRGTEAIAAAANLATITQPVTVISDSRTPLVNRDKNPPATTTVRSDVATTANRSAGGLITVPDVSRTTPDQARLRLSAAGLTNATRVQYLSGADLPANAKNIPVGQVIKTLPAYGGQVRPGTSVVLVVRPN
jgi:membrane peptidoglycan carboxypeptidase